MQVTIDKLGRTLVEKDGILVHQGSQVIDLDVAAFINREREIRNDVTGGSAL